MPNLIKFDELQLHTALNVFMCLWLKISIPLR
jgi:hypothetical protein